MRQTACARRFLPAMIGGGTWEGAHARHEAARVHHAARRRGGGVAARGARAAVGKLPTIGFLGESTPSGQRQWAAAFVQRLRELGWVEGRNIAIEYRWAEGRNERLAEIVAEFVRRLSRGDRWGARPVGRPHRRARPRLARRGLRRNRSSRARSSAAVAPIEATLRRGKLVSVETD